MSIRGARRAGSTRLLPDCWPHLPVSLSAVRPSCQERYRGPLVTSAVDCNTHFETPDGKACDGQAQSTNGSCQGAVAACGGLPLSWILGGWVGVGADAAACIATRNQCEGAIKSMQEAGCQCKKALVQPLPGEPAECVKLRETARGSGAEADAAYAKLLQKLRDGSCPQAGGSLTQ
jgi:hypothetical protein